MLIMMVNDALYHESDVEDDEALTMLLPPPPPPPHMKLLDPRCLNCVINYLDAKSSDALAHSCRFLRDACAAADPTPLIATDTESASPSFDALDELSHKDSRDLNVSMHSDDIASISNNSAPSCDESDEMKSTASPYRSADEGIKQDGDFQVFIHDHPAPSFDESDEMKSTASPSRSSNDNMQDYGSSFGVNSVNQAPSVDESDEMKSTESPSRSSDDGTKQDYELQAFISSDDPAPSFDESDEMKSNASPSRLNLPSYNLCENEEGSMDPQKLIRTPTKERRILTPERSFTPSTQNSSGSDDSEVVELHPERKTPHEGTFGSLVSDFMGDMFGSVKEVASALTLDSNVKRNNIDDRGPIKIGEKLYSHDEALKMWKKAKRNLEDTYAEVDASGNDKYDTTTFFEKSAMYKENASRARDKRKSRNKAPITKRLTKKQGGSFIEAQEKSLKKLLMSMSLEEVVETITQPVERLVNEEVVDSDDSSNASSSCSSRSRSSTSSATSSFESSEYRTSQMRPVAPITEDISVAVSSAVDSAIGSNYGVEVSSSCCKFVSGKAEPQLIKDARGYKDVVHKPERTVSTRKPRNSAGHGLGISSSKRRNTKPAKEDRKKSSRSLKLKLMKKSRK